MRCVLLLYISVLSFWRPWTDDIGKVVIWRPLHNSQCHLYLVYFCIYMYMKYALTVWNMHCEQILRAHMSTFINTKPSLTMHSLRSRDPEGLAKGLERHRGLELEAYLGVQRSWSGLDA